MGNQISLARSYEPYEVKQFEGKKLKTYLKKKPHCINQLEKYENGNLETLLSFAIRERRFEDVKFLLSKGADPNIKDIAKLLEDKDPIYCVPIQDLNVHHRKRVMLWTAVH